MARIRTYDIVTVEDLDNNDYLLGNDDTGNSTVITKRFGLDTLRSFILNNTGLILTDEVHPGAVPSTNHEGTDVEASPITVTTVDRVNGTAIAFGSGTTSTDSTFAGDVTVPNQRVDLIQNGNGGTALRFYNYNAPYILSDFANTSVRITDTVFSNTIEGTLGAIIPQVNNREFFVDTATNDYYYEVVFTPATGTTITQTHANMDTVVLADTPISHEVMMGNISVGNIDAISITTSGASCFNGTTAFKADVTIGTDGPDGTGEANLHVHGDIHLDDNQGSLIFGSPEPSVILGTVNGDDLSITGQGDVTFALTAESGGEQGKVITRNPVDIEQTINLVGQTGINVLQANGMEFSTPLDILPVVPNDTSTTNAGILTDIRIGNEYYHLPTAFQQTAFALPGLSEGLSGVPFDTDGTTPLSPAPQTGSFFYARDDGATAFYDPNEAGSTFNFISLYEIASGSTSVTLPQENPAGTPNPDIAGIRDAFEATPPNRRLMFAESTFALPGTAGTLATRVYEVVNFLDRTVTFSMLGAGNIIISAPTVSITSVPTTTPPNNRAGDFVLRQPDNTLTVSSMSEIAGAQAQVTYTDTNSNNVNVRSIQYCAAEGNITDTTPGELVVDITGRYRPFMDGAEQTSNQVLTQPFQTVVLGAITTDQTIELPTAAIGDSIKIVNLSTIGDNGAARTSAGTWSITPAVGQRIMKLNERVPMELNDPTASFELNYVSDAAGWVIIGIN